MELINKNHSLDRNFFSETFLKYFLFTLTLICFIFFNISLIHAYERYTNSYYLGNSYALLNEYGIRQYRNNSLFSEQLKNSGYKYVNLMVFENITVTNDLYYYIFDRARLILINPSNKTIFNIKIPFVLPKDFRILSNDYDYLTQAFKIRKLYRNYTIDVVITGKKYGSYNYSRPLVFYYLLDSFNKQFPKAYGFYTLILGFHGEENLSFNSSRLVELSIYNPSSFLLYISNLYAFDLDVNLPNEIFIQSLKNISIDHDFNSSSNNSSSNATNISQNFPELNFSSKINLFELVNNSYDVNLIDSLANSTYLINLYPLLENMSLISLILNCTDNCALLNYSLLQQWILSRPIAYRIMYFKRYGHKRYIFPNRTNEIYFFTPFQDKNELIYSVPDIIISSWALNSTYEVRYIQVKHVSRSGRSHYHSRASYEHYMNTSKQKKKPSLMNVYVMASYPYYIAKDGLIEINYTLINENNDSIEINLTQSFPNFLIVYSSHPLKILNESFMSATLALKPKSIVKFRIKVKPKHNEQIYYIPELTLTHKNETRSLIPLIIYNIESLSSRPTEKPFLIVKKIVKFFSNTIQVKLELTNFGKREISDIVLTDFAKDYFALSEQWKSKGVWYIKSIPPSKTIVIQYYTNKENFTYSLPVVFADANIEYYLIASMIVEETMKVESHTGQIIKLISFMIVLVFLIVFLVWRIYHRDEFTSIERKLRKL